MYITNFGRLLERLISEINADPNKANSNEFLQNLAQAADEWAEIAAEFNGGNDRSFNLCRMGKYIEEICQVCQNPQGYNFGRPIAWQSILEDVIYVSKVVRHELSFNTVKVSPHPRFNETTSEYRHMDPEN